MSATLQNQRTDEPIEILLVEDNPGDARLTREAFSETGSKTTLDVVTNGDDAMERLALGIRSAGASLPDLVLLDLNLPGRDGHDVLEAIRDDPDLRRLPVIVLTSSRADEDIEKCYDADANAYLTKSSDPDEFVQLAESVEKFWFQHARLPPLPP